MVRFRCASCHRVFESADLAPACDRCGSPAMILERRPAKVTKSRLEELPPGVWRYRDFLPPIDTDDVCSLGEGGTPLLRAERLGRELGIRDLWIKDESRNPTGSFMDRGSTVLLSLAKARGTKRCTCVTTGNLGASIAAYCAKAGLEARIQINPNTDQGKLYQMLAYGAKIETATYSRKDRDTLEVTAANPYLLEGEKTTGYEIVQELGWKYPGVIVVPVGTGGHLSMIWRSMKEFFETRISEGPAPRLFGVQLEGLGTPPAGGRRKSSRYAFPLAELSESEPYFRSKAESAILESRGRSVKTGSTESIGAMDLLARAEGIFAEPSAASVIAALSTAINDGSIGRDELVVCVITGAGLKDTEAVSRLAKETRSRPRQNPYLMPSSRLGETKLAVLRLLQKRPYYGYEIGQALRQKREISMASIYQHLTELMSFDLVRKRGSTVSGGRERVFYELTRRGSDFLRIAGTLESRRRN